LLRARSINLGSMPPSSNQEQPNLQAIVGESVGKKRSPVQLLPDCTSLQNPAVKYNAFRKGNTLRFSS